MFVVCETAKKVQNCEILEKFRVNASNDSFILFSVDKEKQSELTITQLVSRHTDSLNNRRRHRPKHMNGIINSCFHPPRGSDESKAEGNRDNLRVIPFDIVL
jgi:hypothetical protein